MTYIKGFQCTLCGTSYDSSYQHHTCEHCGESGILDILYDYKKIKEDINVNLFKETHISNMWKYSPFMPIKKPIENGLDVGGTPLYKLHNLEKDLGLNHLYLKDEGVNPSGSLKDRASIVACAMAIESGKKEIACSSTGNAATSLAANAAKLGLTSYIFVPNRVPDGKLAQLIAYGAHVIKVKGDYKMAFNTSKEAIKTYEFYNRNAAINPFLVEGKKTVIYEVIEQLSYRVPDYIIVSVGDGCTIGSIYNGLNDWYKVGWIDRIPKIIGVQAKGCSPIYDAFISGNNVLERDENTIADSIAVGIPRNPVKALRAVIKTKGLYITVTDEEIKDAIMILGNKEGIFAEPASAASIAGLVKLHQQNFFKKADKIVIIHTGNGLKDPKAIKDKLDNITELKDSKNIKKIKQKVTK